MMPRIRLKGVNVYRDRHGRERVYYRVKGRKLVPLAGPVGSPEFMRAYQTAVLGVEAPKPSRGEAGSFDRLVADYFRSPDYLRLATITKQNYRVLIERVVKEEDIGHRQVSGMTREHVKTMMARRSDRPAAANDWLKKLKILMAFAIDSGWRKDDPTYKIKKYESGSFHSWTEEEITTFTRRWPVGTNERLAFDLLLYTGQRRGDVVRMEWSHVTGEGLAVVQSKTGARLTVPLHPSLNASLAACTSRDGYILATSYGQPFTPAGFGNFMHDAIRGAGLPSRCVSHGLRKAAARRLAEAGCSANEIASITGHATLAEVERYTRAAEQKRLARNAMGRLNVGD